MGSPDDAPAGTGPLAVERRPARVPPSRGAVYMLSAQAIFVVTSAFLHFWLTHRLGPARYGTFGVLLVIYSLANLVQNSGIWPAMSKRIAESPTRAAGLFRTGANVQLAWCGITTVVGLALAWPVAWLLRDASLGPLIALAVLLVPLFALYSIANGYHNGLHSFDVQASMLISYTLGRLAATLLLVSALPENLAPVAALVGFAASPLFGLLSGLKGLPRPGRGDRGWRELVVFAWPVTIAAGSMVVVMSIDVLAVKALVGIPALVGYYSAASTISSLPYAAFSALSVVILPTVASARAETSDSESAARISDSLRLVLVLLLPVVLFPAALALGVVTLACGPAFAGAAPPLMILLIGYGFLAYALIEQNVANGLGKPRISMVAGLFAVAVSLGGNLLLVPRLGLLGAAISTTLAGVAMVFGIRPALTVDGITTGLRRWLPALVITLLIGYGLTTLRLSGWVVLVALAAGVAASGLAFIMVAALDADDLARLRAGLRRG